MISQVHTPVQSLWHLQNPERSCGELRNKMSNFEEIAIEKLNAY